VYTKPLSLRNRHRPVLAGLGQVVTTNFLKGVSCLHVLCIPLLNSHLCPCLYCNTSTQPRLFPKIAFVERQLRRHLNLFELSFNTCKLYQQCLVLIDILNSTVLALNWNRHRLFYHSMNAIRYLLYSRCLDVRSPLRGYRYYISKCNIHQYTEGVSTISTRSTISTSILKV